MNSNLNLIDELPCQLDTKDPVIKFIFDYDEVTTRQRFGLELKDVRRKNNVVIVTFIKA